jgi:hypothetical protein
MAIETVRITESNDENDIVVRVFDETGTTLITSGTTGEVEDGYTELSLEGSATPGTIYQLRFFLSGGRVVQPQYIQVVSPPEDASTGANNFEITAEMFVQDQAVDPVLCRCSGIVRGPNGKVKRGVDIQFIPKFNPLVVGTNAVLGERVSVRTDKDGFIAIDLFRFGMYEVTIQSQENVQRDIVVPDAAAIEFAFLLFPIVVELEYDPTPPFAVEVGEEIEITPNAIANNLQELGLADADVCYSIEDESIAAIQIMGDRIVLRGIAPGATNLRATRRDNSIVYIPDPGIENGSVGITVVAP